MTAMRSACAPTLRLSWQLFFECPWSRFVEADSLKAVESFSGRKNSLLNPFHVRRLVESKTIIVSFSTIHSMQEHRLNSTQHCFRKEHFPPAPADSTRNFASPVALVGSRLPTPRLRELPIESSIVL